MWLGSPAPPAAWVSPHVQHHLSCGAVPGPRCGSVCLVQVRFVERCGNVGLGARWVLVVPLSSCSESVAPQGPHSESGVQGWRDSAGQGFGAWTQPQMSH